MASKEKSKIYEVFSNLVSSFGYSRVHGYVLATLLVHKELSLKEIAEKTNYSLASVSLSLDLIEVLGLVERFRKDKSKEVSVRLKGDVLVALKKIVLLKIHRGIETAISELKEENSKEAKKVEKEIKRLKKYVDNLNKVEIPKK